MIQDNWSKKCVDVEVTNGNEENEEILIVKLYKGKIPLNIMTMYGMQESGEEVKEKVSQQVNTWEQQIIEMQQDNKEIIGDLNVKIGNDEKGIKGNSPEISLGSAGEYLRYKYLDTYLRYLKSILYFVSRYIFKHVSCISIKDTFTVYFVSFYRFQIQILCTAA